MADLKIWDEGWEEEEEEKEGSVRVWGKKRGRVLRSECLKSVVEQCSMTWIIRKGLGGLRCNG